MLYLVSSIGAIFGKVAGKDGDQQFRLFVELSPDAEKTLSKSSEFEKGSNKVLGIFQPYHKGFPTSFRQPRENGKKGNEAGLQISISNDGRNADIDIDFSFGRKHPKSTNSDVRAPGNYQKFIDRWPKLTNWWEKKRG